MIDRQPSRFATYNADVRHMIGEIKRNAMGEYLTAVTADYDPDTGKTRVGFAYTTADEFADHFEKAGS